MNVHTLRRILSLAVLALLATPALLAQPWGAWIILDPSNPGYIEVPHHAQLHPNSQFTLEAWVAVANQSGCFSFVGKNWRTTWWVGMCNNRLRSFLKGETTVRDAGDLDNQWNHIAVTYDGAHRRHYINGELVGIWAESGSLPGGFAPLRIGSDVEWPFTPKGVLDEVRLWNVARSTQEIRDALNERMTTPMPGLVAVWAMNGAQDEVGIHDGILQGTTPFLTFPVAPGCVGNSTNLCLYGRFNVRVEFRRPNGVEGIGTVVPFFSPRSGLFWFFNPDNWEMLVKMVNGCGNNGRWWVFFAATTNVFYRLEVLDVPHGVQKIYFNYQGVPSPAVTDTQAFATCP